MSIACSGDMDNLGLIDVLMVSVFLKGKIVLALDSAAVRPLKGKRLTGSMLIQNASQDPVDFIAFLYAAYKDAFLKALLPPSFPFRFSSLQSWGTTINQGRLPPFHSDRLPAVLMEYSLLPSES